MLLLAIESSCDETAVAIIRGGPEVGSTLLSSKVASQIPLHRRYGGVVPELASRNHSLHLRPLVEEALREASVDLKEIDAFAATSGPGLASTLLIGATAAKALAAAARKPFLAVNHLEGHLLSPFLGLSQIPPHTALIVSGGHTLLIDVHGPAHYQKLGSTRDDAAGEAYDKVGKMLGLPYPGGPEVEKIAQTGNATAFDFPRSMMKDRSLDFSFSGLKTAVLYTLTERNPEFGTPLTEDLPDLCASFQQAVIDVLLHKTLRAAKECGRDRISLSGGVSLNRTLRAAFQQACNEEGLTLYTAEPSLCTDNAAMIAFAGLLRHLQGETWPLDSDIDPSLPLVS
ncbi:MAG: tRNA (adenosine(37)-N6)-threonylcarbamoyltransferase complex transferase subunit TsaD [Verrucomicrobiales bacterium]